MMRRGAIVVQNNSGTNGASYSSGSVLVCSNI